MELGFDLSVDHHQSLHVVSTQWFTKSFRTYLVATLAKKCIAIRNGGSLSTSHLRNVKINASSSSSAFGLFEKRALIFDRHVYKSRHRVSRKDHSTETTVLINSTANRSLLWTSDGTKIMY